MMETAQSEVLVSVAPNAGLDGDRALVLRAAGHALVGLVTLVVSAIGIGWALDASRWRAAVPEPFAAKLEACLAAEPNTVFIGSSRYYHQIDPSRIAATMSERGVTGVRAFALGFDALNYSEATALVDALLSDPRSRVTRLIVEPSLRPRLAPGLARSQRAILWHDLPRAGAIYDLILRGDFDLARRLYWTAQHAEPTALRFANVGALSTRFVAAAEPAPDMAELLGPAGDGYAPLVRPPGVAQAVHAADLATIADQPRQRRLGDHELRLLEDLDRRVAASGARLTLVAPPTAHPDIHDEFSAVAEAARSGLINSPTHVFADPDAYPDLHAPEGFRDLDHIWSDVATRFTDRIAEALVADERHAGDVSRALH